MLDLKKLCPTTIESAWRWAAKLLVDSESAQLDAQLLLLQSIEQYNRVYLLTWSDKSLTESQQRKFCEYLQQRISGKPVAHILGEREFWGLQLSVNSSTLIPRPDTETLIEVVLTHISERSELAEASLHVLDLGTGTGAIALALKSEFPTWQVSAVEYNPDAVKLAEYNSLQLQLPIKVYQGSWFEPLINVQQKYDIIVSNPPYIDKADPHLSQGDVRFEPLSALVADNQGLADIQHIAEQAVKYLNKDGLIVIEHGFDQATQVQDIFKKLNYQKVTTTQDLAGQDRITCAYSSSS